MNRVVSGSYVDNSTVIGIVGGKLCLVYFEGFFKNTNLPLNKDTVEKLHILDREESLSLKSSIGRGLVGGALLGGVGVLGGILTSKTKQENLVRIDFKDGKSSTVLVDKKIFRRLIAECGVE